MSHPWHFIAMGVLYIVAGLAHWIFPRIYLEIMPPRIPFKRSMVWLSGLAEVILGAGIFIPSWRDPALYGIMAMLIAFLPVHIYMLQEKQKFRRIPLWLLWIRIPLQGLLVFWAYSYLN